MDLVVIGFNQTNEIVFGDFYFPPSPLKLKFQEVKNIKYIFYSRTRTSYFFLNFLRIRIKYVSLNNIKNKALNQNKKQKECVTHR